MPTSTQLLTFSLTAFLIIAVPGPSVLFAISRSLVLGRLAGVLTVVGNAAGVYVQVVAVAFGLGMIVQQSITLFTVIKLAGAGYLIYLGIQALRHRRSLAAALDGALERKPPRTILREGFIVGIANPKAIVFFSAILPQFVNHPAGDVPIQMLVLGSIFIAIALVSDSVWAILAGTLRSWLSRSPRRLEMIGGVGGLLMIGIGARLALGGRNQT